MAFEANGTVPATTTTTTATKPTTTTTTVPVPTPEPTPAPTTVPGTGKLGDADLNGEVEISDAVKIMSYCTNSVQYPLDAQAIDNADVYARGDGISNMDALAVQKLLANIIASLPESEMEQG